MPVKPDTVISEGYGEPAALSLMAMAFALTNVAGVQAAVGVNVGVGVDVFVAVPVFVAVAVLVGVVVFVNVGDSVAVDVAVGGGPHTLIFIVSMRQPDDPVLLSLPARHLRTMF